jgi:hypothetical protein
MIIKAKEDIGMEIERGAVGFAQPNKYKKIDLKSDLSEEDIKELLFLLGNKFDKFLKVSNLEFRLFLNWADIVDASCGSIPTYDVESLEGFDVVEFDDLDEYSQEKVKTLENVLEGVI